ncbi:putative secreted protein (Por secretion system target) [Maribacter spongiicola]|uniref:Putative secreted protein (Por secretion system target) n=1 Tax=Maribacter spongiicola TaxID=1206753 RepID=A0A4R7K6H2_9FLAO|nr:S8 family serine peptidase [Maribacter spongiicola]TDT46451.1 putative secreted protein (Por secretion system target) [Maribacter spongiicola]
MLTTYNSTYRTSSILILLFFVFSSIHIASAQNSQQRLKIAENNKRTELANFKSNLVSEYALERTHLKEVAKMNNWKIKETLANGKKIELQGIGVDGSPLYYETYSDEAGMVSRASTLNTDGLLGLNLDGDGMNVGVWDAGVALENHIEYASRVTIADGNAEVDAHATRVSGSIISTGIKKDARGVANMANVISHDWTRDKIEVTEAAADGLLISNHSYGIKADRVPDWYFGAYTKVSQDWDKIMYNAPYYLMVTAAGNAQKSRDNETPSYGKTADGFDVLLGFTISKNNITVAAANSKIDGNGNLKSADVSAYSSFGPVDDGRIKPDLAGNGSAVLSTDAISNTSYNTSSGTSMATPGVTGSLLLLQQYNKELYGEYMKAATLKGLALHTADDIDTEGPDYKMGWGVMNAKKAAEVLNNKDFSSHIAEETLENGNSFSFDVTAEGNETLIASISWTDVQSSFINSGQLNNTTAALVNDLDIRITKNGQTFLPWKLNPAQAASPATKGDNLVDPFERVEIPNANGTYTITVTHKGELVNAMQDFSLIVSGVAMTTCSINAPEVHLDEAEMSTVKLAWNASEDALYEIQYKEVHQQEWTTEYISVNNFSWKGLLIDTTYSFRLRTFCSQNIASEFSEVATFTFSGEDTELETLHALSADSDIPFSVYPNPAVDEIQLSVKTSDTATYRIMSTGGVALKMDKASDARINVSDLPSGLYILQIQDWNINKSTKFYKY